MKILDVIPGESTSLAYWWRISNISSILESAGHEVDYIHYCRGKPATAQGSEEHKSNHRYVFGSSLSFPLTHLSTLSGNSYDVVYANLGAACFYSLLGKLKNVPLVFDMHGGHFEELILQCTDSWPTPSILARLAVLKTIDILDTRCSDLVVCVSKSMMRTLNSRGIPNTRLAYATNGADLDFFKPSSPSEKSKRMREALGLDDKLVFGYIGGVARWQGVENFIEAARCCTEGNSAFLVVGGRQTMTDGALHVLPSVPRSEIVDYYSLCDVLVLPRPSYMATVIAAPMKFAEYAAMGKPLLVTKVGDASDFVREYECGVVIENNSVQELVRGINAFASISGKELTEMGHRARILAESQFDWRKIGEGLSHALESLLPY